MSTKIVECVPNFSEGRDLQKLEHILNAIRGVEGVELLDVDPGKETNRTVVTFVGSPAAAEEAAFRAIKRAAEVLDMSKHQGAHARHGATDVCPFVPVSGMTMEECVEIAKSLGKRVGEELHLPVYLYDHAAQVPERRSLAYVRQGEYEALPEKLAKPEWKPDFGPAEFNPRTGVVTIGAREFLIAYNVNLNSRDEAHAADIANEIREKGRAVRVDQSTGYYTSGRLLKYQPSKGILPCGECRHVAKDLEGLSKHYREEHGMDLEEEMAFLGRDLSSCEGMNVLRRGLFRECRAVGWVIPEYGRAQISINLTNFNVTPAHTVLETCRGLAAERGLAVTGSEVVGLIPYKAIRESGEFYLERQGSSRGIPVRDVLECAVQSMGLRDVSEFDAAKSVLGLPSTEGPLASMKVNEFADEVSRSSPAPGGGSIAALAGSLSAALCSMVANLTHGKKAYDEVRDEVERIAMRCQGLKDDLLRAIDEDTKAFNSVLTAMRLPRNSEEESRARDAAIQEGYKAATSVPLRTAELCLESIHLCKEVARKGLEASITDAGVGALMGRAGLIGAIYNVKINLPSITDAAWVAEVRSKLDAMVAEGERVEKEVREVVEQKL